MARAEQEAFVAELAEERAGEAGLKYEDGPAY